MQNGITEKLDAPITTIKVKVGATEYEPRWSFLAEYLLSERGLSLAEVLAETNRGGKRATHYAMELLAACIAHHFPAGAAPDARTLASQIQTAQFRPMWDGVLEAGRQAGAIVTTKNVQTPADQPAVQ